jgi:hypothetical protein
MANPTTAKQKSPKAIRILLVEDNAGDVYLLMPPVERPYSLA